MASNCSYLLFSMTAHGNDREDYSGFRVIHQPAGAGDIFHVSFYGVTCDVVMQSHTIDLQVCF
jgi:hypothetical protein